MKEMSAVCLFFHGVEIVGKYKYISVISNNYVNIGYQYRNKCSYWCITRYNIKRNGEDGAVCFRLTSQVSLVKEVHTWLALLQFSLCVQRLV